MCTPTPIRPDQDRRPHHVVEMRPRALGLAVRFRCIHLTFSSRCCCCSGASLRSPSKKRRAETSGGGTPQGTVGDWLYVCLSSEHDIRDDHLWSVWARSSALYCCSRTIFFFTTARTSRISLGQRQKTLYIHVPAEHYITGT